MAKEQITIKHQQINEAIDLALKSFVNEMFGEENEYEDTKTVVFDDGAKMIVKLYSRKTRTGWREHADGFVDTPNGEIAVYGTYDFSNRPWQSFDYEKAMRDMIKQLPEQYQEQATEELIKRNLWERKETHLSMNELREMVKTRIRKALQEGIYGYPDTVDSIILLSENDRECHDFYTQIAKAVNKVYKRDANITFERLVDSSILKKYQQICFGKFKHEQPDANRTESPRIFREYVAKKIVDEVLNGQWDEREQMNEIIQASPEQNKALQEGVYGYPDTVDSIILLSENDRECFNFYSQIAKAVNKVYKRDANITFERLVDSSILKKYQQMVFRKFKHEQPDANRTESPRIFREYVAKKIVDEVLNGQWDEREQMNEIIQTSPEQNKAFFDKYKVLDIEIKGFPLAGVIIPTYDYDRGITLYDAQIRREEDAGIEHVVGYYTTRQRAVDAMKYWVSVQHGTCKPCKQKPMNEYYENYPNDGYDY